MQGPSFQGHLRGGRIVYAGVAQQAERRTCNAEVGGSIPLTSSSLKNMRTERRDITTVESPGVIAHGVNCRNAMGSGVAKALYTKWPKVKSEYHKVEDMFLGHVHFVEVENLLFVANCFTQEDYGKNGERYADPLAIMQALENVCRFVLSAAFLPKVVHLPQIGGGLGGLDFDKEVAPLLQELELQYPGIEFVVCTID